MVPRSKQGEHQMQKLSRKALEFKMNRACSKACSNLQIDLMRGIPAVAKRCRELIDANVSDDELALQLRAFVVSIAENAR
jgi:hypothetical protein